MDFITLLPEHWPDIKSIYESGLAPGNASFQTSAPPWEEWNSAHLSHSRLAVVEDGKIFPENIASLRLHEKTGFRQVGFREKIGQMNGVWRDTVLLERRSKKVAV